MTVHIVILLSHKTNWSFEDKEFKEKIPNSIFFSFKFQILKHVIAIKLFLH